MIATMKKVSLVVLSSRRTRSIEELRELGAIHIETRTAESEELSRMLEQRAKLERAVAGLPPEKSEEESSVDAANALQTALQAAEEVQDLVEERRDIYDALEKLERERQRLAPWGDFPPELVRELADRGVVVRLYTETVKRFAKLPDRDQVFEVARGKDTVRFVRVGIGSDEDASGPGEEEPLPARGLSAVDEEIAAKRGRLGEIANRLAEFDAGLLTAGIAVLNRDIEFAAVDASMTDDSEVCFVTGFVPEDRISDLRSAASSGGWALLVQDPEPDDPVPTQIKNPRSVRIIQPVFDLLGTIPGYRELDISFWFLAFFSVFFAMIIGDGGYGLVILGLSVTMLVKSRRQTGRVSDGVILLTFLSVCTVVWGAITGNWFGYEGFSELPILSALIIPGLDSFVPRSAFFIQWICFVLGAVHLAIAHTWNFIRAIRSRPRVKAFSELGWLAMVFGVYFLVLNVVLDSERFPIPQYALYAIAIGLGLVLITSQQRVGGNFFVGIGRGLANIIPTALDSINVFSDTVSYIRLYAVGLASIEIAKSFNAMAGTVGSGVGGVIAGALILALGHTLNLAMGALSVVVHGVRLNMLEFSGHLGMEWTGTPYRPFGEEKKTA